ncbi:NADP-dependent oxidoreductase [Brevibacterium aurantiacum]|uniref:NADP-dependent oxidoreductase n=1 Tax=Brevibacterium aurantiacum TaxID=273384 RepID=A0A3Q9NU83_BREAU|nr:NADP-dependent oxidoreductase [Brevibacterium aurantiacum]AZT95158.1 NADP-dependent oxidoreductase [Brevibacterium aurantiacum]
MAADSPTRNRRCVLTKRPQGGSVASCFEMQEEQLSPLGRGEARVRVEWLSIDPTQRGWLNPGPNYRAPVGLGEVMRGAGVGTVVETDNETLPVGAKVYGELGWQTFAAASASGLFGVNIVPEGIEPRHMLSVFGTNGLTAYFGMTEIGRPSSADTVLVSAAAGATGSIAAQISSSLGCRTIGIAGGQEKCEWVRESAGLDACIDYKSDNVAQALNSLAPGGIDVYFDNVGGELLEAAVDNLADHGRIVLCGAVATGYDGGLPATGLRNYMQLGLRRARMEGFVFFDYIERFPDALAHLSGMFGRGELKVAETIAEGVDAAPGALDGLFTGANLGKQLVRV